MEILKLKKSNEKQVIKRTAQVLKRGGVVVYPTDTVYGIGCDATKHKSVNKIFKIKKRLAGQALPMICPSVAMAKKYVKFSSTAQKLAKKHWPGALTMILPIKSGLKFAKGVIRQGYVGIRVPRNKFSISLSKKIKKPIVSTSANISGQAAIHDIKKIIKIFSKSKTKPDLIISAGNLKKRKPSTVVKINHEIKVLRPGKIKL